MTNRKIYNFFGRCEEGLFCWTTSFETNFNILFSLIFFRRWVCGSVQVHGTLNAQRSSPNNTSPSGRLGIRIWKEDWGQGYVGELPLFACKIGLLSPWQLYRMTPTSLADRLIVLSIYDYLPFIYYYYYYWLWPLIVWKYVCLHGNLLDHLTASGVSWQSEYGSSLSILIRMWFQLIQLWTSLSLLLTSLA